MYNNAIEWYPLRCPPADERTPPKQPLQKGLKMAISLKDFKQTRYPNLYKSIIKDTKKGYKYLMWMKIDGKLYKKILGHSDTDKLTDKQASELIDLQRADIENGYISSTKMKLDELFTIYFENVKATLWNDNKKRIYERYIQKPLGSKALESIKPMQIKKIVNDLDKRGLKPRTQKTILEVLKPMFKFALENKMMKENPAQNINVKIPNQKKIVTEATELFNQVYQVITTYYKDEPFYQALFLFGFTGRRIGEVLSLKWENIDFTSEYYWIEDTKNNDKQKYPLPPYIKVQLLQIKDTKRGLVFKSPVTGKQIKNYDRQMRKLKEQLALTHSINNPLYQAFTMLKSRDRTDEYIYTLKWDDKVSDDIQEVLEKYDGVKKGLIFENLIKEKFDKLSPHYMRNILVSMLAEQHTEAIVLSGILGHKDVNTINKYLSVNHYKSGVEGMNKISDVLDVEIIHDEV